MGQAVDGVKLATNVVLASGLEEVLDRGVSLVNTAKDLGGLNLPGEHGVSNPSTRVLAIRHEVLGNLLVGLVDVIDRQDSEVAVVTQIAQSNADASLEADLVDGVLVDVQSNGHGKESTARQTVLLDNSAARC